MPKVYLQFLDTHSKFNLYRHPDNFEIYKFGYILIIFSCYRQPLGELCATYCESIKIEIHINKLGGTKFGCNREIPSGYDKTLC